jgi:hypothetical protein
MGMTPEARRHALAMIARYVRGALSNPYGGLEHILTRRDELDTLGTPPILRPATPKEANLSRLHQIAGGIFRHLPDDVVSYVPELNESITSPSIGGFAADAGLLLWVVDLRAPDGTPWVGFFCGTVYQEQDELPTAESRSTMINNLNLNDSAAAWISMTVAGEQLLVRLCSAAHPVDEGLESWSELAAYMVATAAAVGESASVDDPGPASAYLELLHIFQRGAADGYSGAALYLAAAAFRDSFSEGLARTVLLNDYPNGVGVLVPFFVSGEMRALLTVFEAVSDEESQTGVGGVKIFGRLYDNPPIPEAHRWARVFNGDDDIPDDDNDTWTQTTAWLFGSWQALEVAPETASVFYKGFVPNPLRRHVSDVELVRGCIREVWASANRYRLRKEFESTVEGVDVSH